MQPNAQLVPSNYKTNKLKHTTMKKLTLILACLLLSFVLANEAFCSQGNDSIIRAEIEIKSKNVSKEDSVKLQISKDILNNEKFMDFTKEDKDDFISIFAIFCVFVVPALMVIIIVGIIHYNKRKREKAKYELLEKAIASGKDIPIDFFKEIEYRKNYLQQGITNIAIAIGLFLFMYFAIDKSLSTVACIPFFIGVGKIIAHFMSNNEKNSQNHEIEQ